METRQHIFIIGSKGIPAHYGGFETFVQKLVEYSHSEKFYYHIACLPDERLTANEEKKYASNVSLFTVKVSPIGAARAVVYDVLALRWCIRYCRKHSINKPILYVLASRIGPALSFYRKTMNKNSFTVLVNPDGHEWMRTKWNWLIKQYWKYSERRTIQNADMVICDSQHIQNYVDDMYRSFKPATCYIPYGAELEKDMGYTPGKAKAEQLLKTWGVMPNEYYLIVSRFVPENNYETVLREFVNSTSGKSLIIITNFEKNHLYDSLRKKGYIGDKRVHFVGVVYDESILYEIRKMAFAYIHGHSVGGTNPSLLEAMASTNLNLLYDVTFNREVGRDAVYYWDQGEGNLCRLMQKLETLPPEAICEKGNEAKRVIRDNYQWAMVAEKYGSLFSKLVDDSGPADID